MTTAFRNELGGYRGNKMAGLRKNNDFRDDARSWFLADALYDSIQDLDVRSTKYLLRVKNANPNHVLKKYGITPLHIAAGVDNEWIGMRILRLCIEHGGDPNVRCSEGLTPVHVAAFRKKTRLLKFLVQSGGNIGLRDDDGNSPLDYLYMKEEAKNNPNNTLLLASFRTKNYSDKMEEPRYLCSNEDKDDLLEPSNYFDCYSPLYNCLSIESASDEMNEAFVGSDIPSECESFNMCQNILSDIDSELNFVEVYNYEPYCVLGDDIVINPMYLGNENGAAGKSELRWSCESRLSHPLVKAPTESHFHLGICKPPSFSSRCSPVPTVEFERAEDINISSGSCSSCPTEVVKRRLQDNGIFYGPVVKSTKRVYLYQLKKLKQGFGSRFCENRDQLEFNDVVVVTLNGKLKECVDKWARLENEMMICFNEGNPQEGKLDLSKHYFTYLLLDPRVTSNIKKTCNNGDLDISWPYFLKSVFYVGKGKNARPLDHLLDASKSNSPTSEKIQKIQEIWSVGLGIVCIQIFHNINEAEALTREACMISALSIAKLTNVQRGRFYGGVHKWSLKTKRQLGVVLLFRALMLLIAEGERQIFPPNLKK